MNSLAVATPASIEDELAIRRQLEAFAVAAMRLDADLFVDLWTEDGAWKLPSMPEPVRGKAALKPAFKEKMSYVRFISMSGFPSELRVDGDRASCKTYCQELIFPKAGGHKFVAGCFDDQLVKQGGRWLFASRTYEVIGMDPPPAS